MNRACKVYSATVDDAYSVPLYHATTAKGSICDGGFKTLKEAGTGRRGLGGGGSSEEYTSFTSSAEIATGIAKDLKVAVAVANGAVDIGSLPNFMDDVDEGFCSGVIPVPGGVGMARPSIAWDLFEKTPFVAERVRMHGAGYGYFSIHDKEIYGRDNRCLLAGTRISDWEKCFPGRKVVATESDRDVASHDAVYVEQKDVADRRRDLFELFRSFLYFRGNNNAAFKCHVNPRIHNTVIVDHFVGIDPGEVGVASVDVKLPVPADILQKMFSAEDVTREESAAYKKEYMDAWNPHDLSRLVGGGYRKGETGYANAYLDVPLQEINVDPGRLDGAIKVIS